MRRNCFVLDMGRILRGKVWLYWLTTKRMGGHSISGKREIIKMENDLNQIQWTKIEIMPIKILKDII
jgi:hypothetical protein